MTRTLQEEYQQLATWEDVSAWYRRMYHGLRLQIGTDLILRNLPEYIRNHPIASHDDYVSLLRLCIDLVENKGTSVEQNLNLIFLAKENVDYEKCDTQNENH